MANIKSYWITLPVEDINRSKEFYKGIGFKINEEHTNESMLSVSVGNNTICFVTYELMAQFTSKELNRNSNGEEVLISFDVSTKDEVDEIASKIEKNGGTIFFSPDKEMQFYGVGFIDPDGHRLNILEFNF